MKKVYQTPELDVIKITSGTLLQASLQRNGDEENQLEGEQILVKEHSTNVWDIDWSK